MRRVPALFVLSLLTLGTVWLAAGRATAGPALIAAAAGAATVGVRIMLATALRQGVA
jgi:ABC-type hemin transport system substrate-binding protein